MSCLTWSVLPFFRGDRGIHDQQPKSPLEHRNRGETRDHVSRVLLDEETVASQRLGVVGPVVQEPLEVSGGLAEVGRFLVLPGLLEKIGGIAVSLERPEEIAADG